MAAIDTSLLYALFNASDAFHAEAQRLVDLHSPVLVGPPVFQETLGLVQHRQGAAMARQCSDWMEASPLLNIQAEGSQQAFDAAKAAYGGTQNLSFADVWCIAYAHHHGVELLTKDRRQAKAFVKWSQPS